METSKPESRLVLGFFPFIKHLFVNYKKKIPSEWTYVDLSFAESTQQFLNIPTCFFFHGSHVHD